ncbi:TenA family transcriptional regulator [Candidatus Nitrosotenuis uzonensis]|uniref:TENA/THI-4 domain protein n=1 Tax=Candidatus Nitrosotenuis uzonensis TaxID=1407055 RepID=A0A812ETK7_9ARCH|nr:iron-containing redox enzyme family protein [Candidatus Nitrosotenuis uzonensis]CAE6486566.1 TENA/THI-4 domain protein [Candidatus Nitrosotenuis uzonensis]
MNSLSKKIDAIIEEKSLLKHPFYQMWSEGKLSQDSLAGYSKEYFQMVKAVPSFVEQILQFAPPSMTAEIRQNMEEEAEHLQPWVRFAVSLGVGSDEVENYTGLAKTGSAVSELSQLMVSLESGAAAMYAFEKEIPNISHTKLDGLAKFYGINSDDATEYFRLHMEADIRHAATWANILDKIPEERHAELLEVATKSMDAQNHLLDCCYENYCQAL